MFKTRTSGVGSETVPKASKTAYIKLNRKHFKKTHDSINSLETAAAARLDMCVIRRHAQFLKDGNKKENKSSYVSDIVGYETGLTFIYHKNEPTKSVEATCGVYGARRARPAANTLPFSSLHFPFLLSIHFQNR